MAAKKKSKKKTKKLDPKRDFKNPVRKPRQARLPTMDDPKIDVLHGIAEEYAEKRDERMRIGKQEVELKGKILDLMKAHKRTHYHYQDIDVTIITEKEKVRVKIAKPDTGEELGEPEEEPEPSEDPRE
jgi:hypothetical protein